MFIQAVIHALQEDGRYWKLTDFLGMKSELGERLTEDFYITAPVLQPLLLQAMVAGLGDPNS